MGEKRRSGCDAVLQGAGEAVNRQRTRSIGGEVSMRKEGGLT